VIDIGEEPVNLVGGVDDLDDQREILRES